MSTVATAAIGGARWGNDRRRRLAFQPLQGFALAVHSELSTGRPPLPPSLAPGRTPPAGILVSDFDGTMTRHDFYQLARARWWDNREPDPWNDYLARRITHFEALNRFFARVRTDEASLRTFVEGMELDPGLANALPRLRAAGWDIVVASAGCEWYIRHLLGPLLHQLTLHGNPGRFDPDRGLEMILPTTSRFYSPETGIDKVAVVRAALDQCDRVAFAGDGPPDLPAALLVVPERRFARGWLATALAERNEVFQPFEHWAGLSERLLASTPAEPPTLPPHPGISGPPRPRS